MTSSTSSSLRVLVVGATGGSGRATVDALLEDGHVVTAFARTADKLPEHPRLRRVRGDATQPEDVDAVVHGQDAVIVTLGISESPVGVRLRGSRGTPLNVRSGGTNTVMDAMHRHGVKRLVVLSSYGVGPTRKKLRLADRLVFWLLLRPQIRDTEIQERAVRTSELDWVIAQPVHLTDEEEASPPFLSLDGVARRFRVSRRQVARVLAGAVRGDRFVGRSVAVSG